MRRILTMTVLFAAFSTAALADSLRSDKHFVKIDVQQLGSNSRQYNVQVFDAASREHVTQLRVMTKGDTPEETETVASGTRYQVRIDPHGAAYLIAFTADDGAQVIDAMRGGFTVNRPADRAPAQAARAGRDVPEPAVTRRIEPVYTDEARAAGAVGTVVLEVRIDKSGFVREATVLQPMGYGLSESAVDAVKQWQFAPSMHGGRPVEVIQEVTIEFKP